MGMAKLNVLVSGMDDPCGLSDRTWWVTIYDCDGNVLDWCGKRYVVMRAECGHLEVEVPPGCYYLKAVWSFTIVTPNLVYRVNHFTDAAIVTACCEQTTCVKLFNPSAHRCGYIYIRAIRDLLKQKALRPQTARQAEQAIDAVLAELPRPLKEFELGHEEEIVKLISEQAETGGRDAEECN